jgi:hypothetical protein
VKISRKLRNITNCPLKAPVLKIKIICSIPTIINSPLSASRKLIKSNLLSSPKAVRKLDPSSKEYFPIYMRN